MSGACPGVFKDGFTPTLSHRVLCMCRAWTCVQLYVGAQQHCNLAAFPSTCSQGWEILSDPVLHLSAPWPWPARVGSAAVAHGVMTILEKHSNADHGCAQYLLFLMHISPGHGMQPMLTFKAALCSKSGMLKTLEQLFLTQLSESATLPSQAIHSIMLHIRNEELQAVATMCSCK